LLGQWQAELYDLFGIEAREGRHDPEAFAGDGVFLVHREYAGGKGAPLLSAVGDVEPFDLVVIDEAHEFFANIYRRFDKEGNYETDSDEAQIADRVRSLVKIAGTPVLLLTATRSRILSPSFGAWSSSWSPLMHCSANCQPSAKSFAAKTARTGVWSKAKRANFVVV
jgi:hypothetical protein